ncbi:unnamed protein product [Calypogeia fissa]
MQAGWSPHSLDEGELGGWTLSMIEKAPPAMQNFPDAWRTSGAARPTACCVSDRNGARAMLIQFPHHRHLEAVKIGTIRTKISIPVSHV